MIIFWVFLSIMFHEVNTNVFPKNYNIIFFFTKMFTLQLNKYQEIFLLVSFNFSVYNLKFFFNGNQSTFP